MEQRGPGIAKVARRRASSFSTLLDQVLEDESALDALVFAYEELALEDRRALVLAIRQDAARPVAPLTALLSVEEDPALRSSIAGLIERHARIGRSALAWGDPTRGGAALIQAFDGGPPETLLIAWNEGAIDSLRIESRTDLSFFESGEAGAPADVVDRVLPMIWQYVRGGNPLPAGIARFAGFLSLP